MHKVFIGLLVGICVIMFSSPLMAADTPEGIDLSTLQALDDIQLSHMRGKDQPTSLPDGFRHWYFTASKYPPGIGRASFINEQNGNISASNSRVFVHFIPK